MVVAKSLQKSIPDRRPFATYDAEQDGIAYTTILVNEMVSNNSFLLRSENFHGGSGAHVAWVRDQLDAIDIKSVERMCEGEKADFGIDQCPAFILAIPRGPDGETAMYV